jgi:hypothetical protein
LGKGIKYMQIKPTEQTKEEYNKICSSIKLQTMGATEVAAATRIIID